jgi:hypothetical protein
MSKKYRLEIVSGRHGLDEMAWDFFPRLVPTAQSESFVIYAASADEPVDPIRLGTLEGWKEDGDIIDFDISENGTTIIRPFLSCSEAEIISGLSSEYWRQQCWKEQIPGAYKSGKQWYIPRKIVEKRKKSSVPQIIEISQEIKERCIDYARQIAVYRGYDDLVNGLQPAERLMSKHDAEWLELREAFVTKTLAHQYHEAADVFYYANQLEQQSGESWIAQDLHSMRNTYGLNPEKVQRCAEAKYGWRASGENNKNEAYELDLIEDVIGKER